MFRRLWLLAVCVFVSISPAQEANPGPADPKALRVEVPTFGNPNCPIMGKKVSMPLFIDTELGRFYVCCKPCYRKILLDLPAAHKTAYPVVEEVKNTVCPVSGEPLGKDALEITLQGARFRLCCAACVDAAKAHAQIVLTKLLLPQVVDVGNLTCPVSGGKVTANAFVLIGDAMVHIASPTLVDDIRKDPATILTKAQAIAKAQPPPPKHEHQKPPAAPTPAPAKDGGGEGGK